MVADAVESASRTLSEPTPARIEGLVTRPDRQAAPRRPVRRVRPDPPRDRRDPRQPDQVADRHLSRPRQVPRTTHRLIAISSSRPCRRQQRTSLVRETTRKKRRSSSRSVIRRASSRSMPDSSVGSPGGPRGRGSGSRVDLDRPGGRPDHSPDQPQHLGHDWPTDVISFPLSGPESPSLLASWSSRPRWPGHRAGRSAQIPPPSWPCTWFTACFIFAATTMAPTRTFA